MCTQPDEEEGAVDHTTVSTAAVSLLSLVGTTTTAATTNYCPQPNRLQLEVVAAAEANDVYEYLEQRGHWLGQEEDEE